MAYLLQRFLSSRRIVARHLAIWSMLLVIALSYSRGKGCVLDTEQIFSAYHGQRMSINAGTPASPVRIMFVILTEVLQCIRGCSSELWKSFLENFKKKKTKQNC